MLDERRRWCPITGRARVACTRLGAFTGAAEDDEVGEDADADPACGSGLATERRIPPIPNPGGGDPPNPIPPTPRLSEARRWLTDVVGVPESLPNEIGVDASGVLPFTVAEAVWLCECSQREPIPETDSAGATDDVPVYMLLAIASAALLAGKIATLTGKAATGAVGVRDATTVGTSGLETDIEAAMAPATDGARAEINAEPVTGAERDAAEAAGSLIAHGLQYTPLPCSTHEIATNDLRHEEQEKHFL
jgi:hypothetical protein